MESKYPKDLIPKFFANTARTYDRIVFWCTFGKDKQWKNFIVNQIGHADYVLDLACGTGILTRKIADRIPESVIIGVDMTEDYLSVARRNSSAYSNISYVHQDAENLVLDEKFDCICSSYIPKYCDPVTLVKNCIKHLNVNGKIILHDFTYPKNRLVCRLWDLYFLVLNRIAIFIPSWKEAFLELPKLIRFTTWTETYRKELEKSGFDVKCYHQTWNTSAVIVASAKSN